MWNKDDYYRGGTEGVFRKRGKTLGAPEGGPGREKQTIFSPCEGTECVKNSHQTTEWGEGDVNLNGY